MVSRTRRAIALILFSSTLSLAAYAQKPTFNCANAVNEVEKLICSNPSLASRDRALSSAYKSASAKAKGALAASLKQTQRGWVKARNECWKAKEQTWITASWTVNTVKDCVDAQYRMRTSELQAVWRLVSPKTISYSCQENPANELVANYFETDPATIRLERGDRTVTMWAVGTASNQLYEGQNVSLSRLGADVKVNWLDTRSGKTEAFNCKER